MDVNGESVYGTTANVFEELPWGRCTVKSNAGRQLATTTLYLHVFDWPESGELVVPGLGNECLGARLLADPDRTIGVDRGETDVRLSIGAEAPDEVCSVVALEIRGEPVVYRAPVISSPSGEFVRALPVTLDGVSPGLAVHYTLDGSDPTVASPVYTDPIIIERTTAIRARSFHGGLPVSSITEARFFKVVPMSALDVAGREPGVRREVFAGDWDTMPDFDGLEPETVITSAAIDLGPEPRRERYGQRLSGYLYVPESEVYVLALSSDDGSRLFVHKRLVADNDGLHGTEEVRGTMALAKGWHPITVEYFNKTGGASLGLRVAPLGAPLAEVPPDHLAH
jgi:hypothetical protein